MTQPPTVPMPPAFTGLEDLSDDMAGPAESLGDNPFEDPDFVLGNAAVPEGPAATRDTQPEPSPDTAADEIEPGVPAQPPTKGDKRGPGVTIIDWAKATPRREDSFASTPTGQTNTSPGIAAIRDFLNQARQEELYGLFYPVLSYGNRNSAQAYVAKINHWRKGKTNQFGVRDGEAIAAKCERKAKDEFVVWVGLLKDPGAKGEVNPPEKTISITPEAG